MGLCARSVTTQPDTSLGKLHAIGAMAAQPDSRAYVIVGDGTMHYPYSIGTASYFTLAPGGGVNLRFTERLHVHVDYEYQIWHNAPGFAGEPNHPLRPNGINIGVAWRVWPFKPL